MKKYTVGFGFTIFKGNSNFKGMNGEIDIQVIDTDENMPENLMSDPDLKRMITNDLTVNHKYKVIDVQIKKITAKL